MATRRTSVKKTQPASSTYKSYQSYRSQKRARTAPVSTISRSTLVSLIPETKYFDCGINTNITSGSTDWQDALVPCDNYVNTSGTAAAYTDCALIPSAIGSGYGQINGNRYKLKKIRVRGRVVAPSQPEQADALAPRAVRLMLVMDMQPNGAQAASEVIMQDIGANETQWSFKRIGDSSGRFRILKDEFFSLNNIVAFNDAAATGSLGFEAKQFSFQYTPRTPITVNVKSASATPTVASLITHNIFLVLHTNGVLLNIAAASRCYYSD